MKPLRLPLILFLLAPALLAFLASCTPETPTPSSSPTPSSTTSSAPTSASESTASDAPAAAPAASTAGALPLIEEYKFAQDEAEYPIQPFHAILAVFPSVKTVEDLKPILPKRLASLPIEKQWEVCYGAPFNREATLKNLQDRVNLTVEVPSEDPLPQNVSVVRYIMREDLKPDGPPDLSNIRAQVYLYEDNVWKPYVDGISVEKQVLEDALKSRGVILEKRIVVNDSDLLKEAAAK